MKRFFLFLTALVICMTCSGFLFYWPETPTDPVLEPVDAELPPGRITALGDSYILIYNLGEAPVIANVETGSVTPVTFVDDRPGDQGQTLERFTYTIIPRVYLTGGRYSILTVNGLHGLIDRERATITRIWRDEFPAALTHDGMLLFCQQEEDACVLTLQTPGGDVLRSAPGAFDGYSVQDVYPLRDGFLLMLSGEVDAEWNVQRAFVRMDRELNAGPVVSLGSIYLSAFHPIACHEGTGGLLLLALRNGLLILSEAEGPIALVSWTDDGFSVTEIESPESLGALLAGAMANVSAEVSGVSVDGEYALLNAMLFGRGLFKLDISTLTFTEQMTHDELISIGLSPLKGFTWPGGEYAFTIEGVYRVTQR